MICECLIMGKFGVFVVIVDCIGIFDGIYILKIDNIFNGWDGEEVWYQKVIFENVFLGKIFEIVLSLEVNSCYCMFIKLVG